MHRILCAQEVHMTERYFISVDATSSRLTPFNRASTVTAPLGFLW